MHTVQSSSHPGVTGLAPSAGDQRKRRSAGAEGSLLFAEDVASILGMTTDWIYAETRAGRIPHIALGRYYRYRRESIEAWLQDKEHSARSTPSRGGRRR